MFGSQAPPFSLQPSSTCSLHIGHRAVVIFLQVQTCHSVAPNPLSYITLQHLKPHPEPCFHSCSRPRGLSFSWMGALLLCLQAAAPKPSPRGSRQHLTLTRSQAWCSPGVRGPDLLGEWEGWAEMSILPPSHPSSRPLPPSNPC